MTTHPATRRAPIARNLVWLLAAAPFLFLSNGRWIVPAAAWIGPALVVRFLRSTPSRSALAAAYAVGLAVRYAQWWGLVPLPVPLYVGVGAAIELAVFLPYVADARLARRLGGVAATLVLPTVWASVDLLLALAGPYGSWGSVAYSQYGALPLMQLASVTGMTGITFLIGWWASASNAAWEELESRAGTGGLAAAASFAVVVATILVLGGLRLAAAPAGGPTVRVAAVVPAIEADDPARGLSLAGDLFDRSAREAAAGARVVAWPEGSITIYARDEAAVHARAAEVARAGDCYLALAYYAREDEATERYENKAVLVDPSGAVAWEYLKSRAVPGREERLMIRGDGIVPPLETGYGRLATLICYDADHADLVARAAGGADLLLLPSNDWRAIDPLHTRMAVFRAVETGVSLVRVTLNGLSIAVDPRGEVRASSDAFESPGAAMSAVVPATRVPTVYARVGDLFGWLSVAGALGLAVTALRGRRRG